MFSFHITSEVLLPFMGGALSMQADMQSDHSSCCSLKKFTLLNISSPVVCLASGNKTKTAA